MTVVWSTAYLDEAERCDEVVVLHQGYLLGQAVPGDFLAPVRGRTLALRTLAGERRGAVHRALMVPGVLDAVIQGRTVRLLLAAGAAPPPATLLVPAGAAYASELVPVEPRFEDAVIALLRERSSQGETAVPGQSSDPGTDAGVDPPSPTTLAAAGELHRAASRAVIEIEQLTRLFGDFRAVDGISLSVPAGETFGLLGPNGAGKSTTFKMLCGLLPPSAGKALVLGIDLGRTAAAARARIGYMSQKFALYGVLSVLQNLRFFGSAYGLTGRRLRARIDRMLDEFGLHAYADRTSEDLPLGYKQRLSLACAILHEPEILFLDEPTSGVDPLTRREFWARINAMAGAGVTVMVTTHFLDEAEYCDRLGIVYRGQLIALGPADDLKARARGPELPDPTLEDAFIGLIEAYDHEHPQ
jgi:ABC-2 type transport system ATP-binding protein